MSTRRTATTKPEKHNCVQSDALDELLRALEVSITSCLNDGSEFALQIAANLNLCIQGAKSMAEIDDE